MGSQWAGMGAQLMRLPIFAAAIERYSHIQNINPHYYYEPIFKSSSPTSSGSDTLSIPASWDPSTGYFCLFLLKEVAEEEAG